MGRTYVRILLCQVAAALAALATLRWLAIHVNPEAYGRYALYHSVVSAGALFLISWPNAALLRFGREEWTQEGRAGRALAGRMALFVSSVVIAVAIAWLMDSWIRDLLNTSVSPFNWIVAGLVVVPAADLAIYLSQVVGRPQAYGYSPLITRCGFLLGVVLIPLLKEPLEWTYLAGWMLGSATVAAATMTLGLPRGLWSGFRLSSGTLARILKYSWTLPFAAMSTYVVNWVDTWVIRGFYGVEDVGVYNWGYQIMAMASLAFAPIAVILTPRVIDARLRQDQKRINSYVGSILPTTVFASCAVALTMTLVGPLMTVMASPAYADAGMVIRILLIALPFQLLGYLVTPLGNADENLLPRFVMVSIVVAAVNMLGDIVLVPWAGIAGASAATTIAFMIGGLLQVSIVRRSGDFPPIWYYSSAGWLLVSACVALWLFGALLGGVLVVAGAVAVAGAYVLLPVKPASSLSTTHPLAWLKRLPSALALSDAA